MKTSNFVVKCEFIMFLKNPYIKIDDIMPYFGDLAQYLVTLKLLASEDNKYQGSQIIERMNMTNNYIFSNSFFENFYIIMILVLLKKQNLFLIKEKPKILGFFIIIKGGWGLDVDDWHWIYIWLDCQDSQKSFLINSQCLVQCLVSKLKSR